MGAIAFMFNFMLVALCIGVVLSFIVCVPLAIYCIPYALWVGSQNLVGKQLDKKDEKVSQIIKNATKLYSCWIRRKKPSL